MFFIWDGLFFFGFDDTKLARIKTKKPKFADKLTSKKWMAILISTIIIATTLIVKEINRYGEEKSQSISLVPASKYDFDINSVFSFLGAVYFYMDELVPVI